MRLKLESLLRTANVPVAARIFGAASVLVLADVADDFLAQNGGIEDLRSCTSITSISLNM